MNRDTDIKTVATLMALNGEPDHAARERARARLLSAAGEPRSRRSWISRGRIVAGFAVLALGAGGGVAAATGVFSSRSTTLVARGISCQNGTPQHFTVGTYDIEQDGRTPQAACADVLHVPASQLVVCEDSVHGLSVWKRDSGDAAEECRSGGMSAGVPRGFRQATAAVGTLERRLNRLYVSQNCFSVATLKAASDAVLVRLGFTGWRTVDVEGNTVPTGRCAHFPSTGNSFSDAAAALDGGRREVMIDVGPSRRIAQIVATTSAALFASSPTAGPRCATPGAERYVTQTLRRAGATGRIRFAVTREATGTSLGDGNAQARYEAGCAVFVDSKMAPDGRTFLVELWRQDAAALSAGAVPPDRAYRPVS